MLTHFERVSTYIIPVGVCLNLAEACFKTGGRLFDSLKTVPDQEEKSKKSRLNTETEFAISNI